MAGIVNIMANRTVAYASRNGGPSRPIALAVVGCLVGVALLVLGIPRMIAGFQAITSSDVQWALESGRPVAPERIAAAVAALSDASGWEPSAERDGLRGFLLIRQAEATPPGPEREQLYADALAAMERGVAFGPVQPHAWVSLAVLRERAGNVQGAVAALRMSMLSGAFEPRLMLWRLRVGVRLRAAIDEETLSLLRRQIRLAWVYASDDVMKLGAESQGGDLIRQSLEELSEEEVSNYLQRARRN